MIDWHSHILPGIDDGSHSIAESLTLIDMLDSQGVDLIMATPHFFANDESIDMFLKRRSIAFNALKNERPTNTPSIMLGAEVNYFPGISRMEQLELLRIEGTKLLLLEMPLSTWSKATVRELIELNTKGNIQLILAHIERFLNLQNKDVLEELIENDILLQINAGYVSSVKTRRKAISLIKKLNCCLIGSDSHNISVRYPKMNDAFDVIKKKFGEEYLLKMDEYGYCLLGQ